MLQQITCPQCKLKFEISEALERELRDQLTATLQEEHQKQTSVEVQKAVDESSRKSNEEHKKQLEDVRTQTLEDAKKIYGDKYSTDLHSMKRQLEERDQLLREKDQKINASNEKELQLRREKVQLEEEKKEGELTVQRRMDEEKKMVEEKVSDRLGKEFNLRLSEKDQIIQSMTTKIEELQKKPNITSQQLQGEVLEIAVQQDLTETFPDDDIMEVEKFKNGADIRHLVKSKKGLLCGKILWECKRTSNFQSSYIDKLKEDILREEAQFGVIVTTTLSKQALHGLAQINGVWVCSQEFVESLAFILRESLISLAKERWIHANKGSKGDHLIAYFSSPQFAQQVQELAAALHAQREEINKERTIYTKLWADRETQIDRQTRSFAKILSQIQSFVGSGMQQIDAFDLLSLTNGQE